jgi:hypothetical protein
MPPPSHGTLPIVTPLPFAPTAFFLVHGWLKARCGRAA